MSSVGVSWNLDRASDPALSLSQPQGGCGLRIWSRDELSGPLCVQSVGP